MDHGRGQFGGFEGRKFQWIMAMSHGCVGVVEAESHPECKNEQVLMTYYQQYDVMWNNYFDNICSRSNAIEIGVHCFVVFDDIQWISIHILWPISDQNWVEIECIPFGQAPLNVSYLPHHSSTTVALKLHGISMWFPVPWSGCQSCSFRGPAAISSHRASGESIRHLTVKSMLRKAL